MIYVEGNATTKINRVRIVTPQEAQRLVDNEAWMRNVSETPQDLAHTVATETDRTRAAAEQAWDAACDYLASRNWEPMTREEYTAALLKAWNVNPHRDTCVVKNETDL